jgi:hypothetical protein
MKNTEIENNSHGSKQSLNNLFFLFFWQIHKYAIEERYFKEIYIGWNLETKRKKNAQIFFSPFKRD